MRWLRRLRDVIVNRILGLNDTPHRIAWGVFLGFVVAFTPTVGLQMLIYVLVASIFRANKMSGIPPIWLTNPITMVPIYLGCWRIGAFVLDTDGDPERGNRIIASLAGAEAEFSWGRLLEGGFWIELGGTMWELGAELWLGGLVIGATLGGIAYPLTRYGVLAYRRARGG
jgi:uncharacterized protein (DUF2062 family)